MNTSSSPLLDVSDFVLDVLKDYLAGNVDPKRDKMVMGWSEAQKRGVLQIARKKLLPTKK